MKYLFDRDQIYENTDSVTVSIFAPQEMLNIIYDLKTGKYKDDTVFKRIRFFSDRDDLWSENNKDYYVVLFSGELIIGIAKVKYYSMSAPNENALSIGFLSIDKEHRGNKYSRLMVDALFKEAKNKNIEIQTSTYTILGRDYLKPLFNEYAKKYNVVFHDKLDTDSLNDTETMYKIVNGKKLHWRDIDETPANERTSI